MYRNKLNHPYKSLQAHRWADTRLIAITCHDLINISIYTRKCGALQEISMTVLEVMHQYFTAPQIQLSQDNFAGEHFTDS